VSLPIRVLYALWHYPHLSESYVRWEIRAVRSLGVEVEVWAEERATAPYPSEVPYHFGELEKVVADFQPHLIHSHWLRQPRRITALREIGLPVTVRGHSFDGSRKKVVKALRDPMVRAAFPFPQYVPRRPWLRRRVLGIPAGFDPSTHSPGENKDHRLVVRTGVALPTKDYRTFFEVALRCPDHRFVLALCVAFKAEHCVDETVELNRALGEPAEIRHDLQHEEVAALQRQAGIYLHTTRPDEPFGMPISIAEAMASGCYVIGRDLPHSRRYVGPAGAAYSSVAEAAALVKQTLSWSNDDWTAASKRSVDRAFGNFVSTDVFAPMVARWREIAG